VSPQGLQAPPTFSSAPLEQFATYMIGVHGMKLLHAKDTYLASHAHGIEWYQFANLCLSHWYLVQDVLGRITSVTRGEAPHFGVVMNNELHKTADYLKFLTGVCPILEKERFNSRDFDFSHLRKPSKEVES
jgi:hypothetical protein